MGKRFLLPAFFFLLLIHVIETIIWFPWNWTLNGNSINPKIERAIIIRYENWNSTIISKKLSYPQIDWPLNFPPKIEDQLSSCDPSAAVHLGKDETGGYNRVSFAAKGILEEARGRPIYFWPTIRYLVSEIAARGMHRGCLHANDLRGADVEGAIPRMNQVTNAMQKPALMLPANCTPLNFPNVPLRPFLRNRSMRLRVSWTGDDRDGGWLECWDEKSHSLVLQQLSDLLFGRIRKFWTKL